ncbi:MAG: hypothetical protein AAFO95_05085 [Cyanobacteria bacterium J06600_6]
MADLITTLKSEVQGEAFFRSAYYAAIFSRHRSKRKALWQLETQTKIRIIEYFQVNNLERPNLGWLALKSSVIGVIYSFFSSNIVLDQIIRKTEYYLEVFRRLENRASEADRQFFEYIVAHEVAIRQFIEIELSNSNENSLKGIKALLND